MRSSKSLADVDPALAAEWHPERNGSLRPEDVMAGTNRKVWWFGRCGHEWEATVNARHRGGKCPYCFGNKVLPGFNDLATTHPALAAEWHPERNGGLRPEDVRAGSGRKVWWLGRCGHEWETSVLARKKGNGCPCCSGLLPVVGENDLATVRPDVAAMWHPAKNGGLRPEDVKKGSQRKVWWECPACGHEWEAKVSSTVGGKGCPRCAGEEGRPEPDPPDPDLGWWKALLTRGRGPGAEKMLAVCRARSPREVREQLAPMAARGWEVVGERGSETLEEMVGDIPRIGEGGFR